jgi:hypothetical protein
MEIMPWVRASLIRKDLFDGVGAKGKHLRLQRYLEQLLPGFFRVRRLPSITDVFSLLDYSIRSETMPMRGRRPEELRECRHLVDEAMFSVLEWPYDEDNIPRVLGRLAGWIHSHSAKPGNSMTVVSSNYDIAVDDMLFWYRDYKISRIASEIDFGFAWRDPESTKPVRYSRPDSPTLAVYKLHGSLNWLRCDACEHMYVNPNGVIAQQAFHKRKSDFNTCHCGHHPLREVVVAPSLVRDIQDVNLREVWKASLEALRQADEWVIIGYSFPPEDLAIRSLFMRGYGTRRTQPRIKVVLPSFSPEVSARYRVLFPDFRPISGGLQGFVRTLPQRKKQSVSGGQVRPPNWARKGRG